MTKAHAHLRILHGQLVEVVEACNGVFVRDKKRLPASCQYASDVGLLRIRPSSHNKDGISHEAHDVMT